MQIDFEVNLDDYLSLNQHLLKTSPLMKAGIRKGRAWWAAGPFVGVTLLAIINKMPFEKAIIIVGIVIAVCSLPAFFLFPLYFKMQNRKFIKKTCESEKSKGVLGRHVITITNDHFNEKTEYNDTSIPWKGIDRIETTPDYTFIFTNEVTAYVVPRKSLAAENYSNFTQEIHKIYNKNHG